jgi:alkanesulfonate monooxygenase SsuD/methylene tetrahydromethanopterin reductase-like flavin-dependent oxidoreductase (luciferase family)
MKFGIFFELSVPRPFSPEREREVITNALEQARVADELGFECAWVVEHHFLEEYSHSSAPELFLTAVAMQTQRIRVGHGAVVCVPEINHPIRVAERAAFLDLLSGGRLEFGTARSSTWTEIGGFEADPDDTKKDWDEYVRVLPKMWMQETFAHRGRCFSMPETRDPAQAAPEAASADVGDGDESGHRARRGRPRSRLPRRRNRELCRAGAPHARVPPTHPAVRAGRCGRERPRRDPELPLLPRGRRCRRRARAALPRHVRRAQRASPVHARGLSDLGLSIARESRALAFAAGRAGRPAGRAGGICIGDPRGIVAAVKRWESIGVDQINVLLNASEVLSQDQVLASLRLFAKEVMPVFEC